MNGRAGSARSSRHTCSPSFLGIDVEQYEVRQVRAHHGDRFLAVERRQDGAVAGQAGLDDVDIGRIVIHHQNACSLRHDAPSTAC